MTGKRLLIWLLVSVLSVAFLFGIAIVAFAFGRGDWVAFFQSPARVAAMLVTFALNVVGIFSGFGGMNPGKKEDRGNRWIFGPLIVLTLCMVVLPPYLDGRSLWVADETITPYVGLALLTLSGILRVATVFALGRRFTGLVAIQENHRLKTDVRYAAAPSGCVPPTGA